MAKFQIDTGKADKTINTNNVWDRIVALENDVSGIPSNVSETLESHASQLAQIVHFIKPTMTQTEINADLQTYDKVKFLNGTYNIDPNIGLTPKSNQEIEFEKNAVIQAIGVSDTHYEMINLGSLSNVYIKGGTLIGDKATHIGTDGEWGYGVYLYNSKNITIEDMLIKDCWGDGVYIGASTTGANENITLKRVVVDGCRRQGFSVISVKGLVMEDCQGLNIYGTAPMAGIDFEPNYPGQTLDRVVVKNFYSYNTAGAGIKVYATDTPYVDITIENHKHEGGANNGSGFDVSGGDNSTQEGKIINLNPIYRNTMNSPFIFRNRPSNKARVEVHNPLVINCNTAALTSTKYASVFPIYAETTDTSNTSKIGNIHIFNPAVKGVAMCNRLLYAKDDKTNGCEKISLINPITIEGCTNKNLTVEGCTDFVVEDRSDVLNYLVNSAQTASGSLFFRKYTLSATATASRLVTIASTLPIGVELEFFNFSSIRTYTLTGALIVAFSTATQTITIPYGARLRIKKIDDTQWVIVSQYGAITVA